MEDRRQAWKDSTWQIHPRLNVPELNPKAVQFAVLDSDPVGQFKKKLLQNRERFRKEIEAEKEPLPRELLKKAQMTATWNSLFRAVHGDQVYLLAPESNPKESLTRGTLVSSNSPPGRKWFTTKVEYLENALTCWCVPTDVSVGKSAEIELAKNNRFNIQRTYHELIEEGQS